MKLKKTLSEQIYQILHQDILTQQIPAGTKLTLKNLQERFEVSSTPIREALTRLTEEGLVSYFSNVGVSVLSFTPEDLTEIFTFMGDLDALAVNYAAQHPDCKELERCIRENLDRCADPSTSQEELLELSDEFHLLFYRYCNNTRLTRTADRLRSQLSVSAYQYERDPETLSQILNGHCRIAENFLAGDTIKASENMRKHLLESLDYALKQLEA